MMRKKLGASMSHSISFHSNKWLRNIAKGKLANAFIVNLNPKSTAVAWFSLIGFTFATLFCLAIGAILSHFLAREVLNHHVTITKQFLNNVEWVASKEAQLGNKISLGQLLDARTDLKPFGIAQATAAFARKQYYDHISAILDVKMANVFARDGTIIWSTNSANIGSIIRGNQDLETAFKKGEMVWNDSFNGKILSKEANKYANKGVNK